MKKKWKIMISAFTILIAGSIMTTVFAGGIGDPGSINDPIVTKSYVDEQINNKVNEQMDILKQQLSKINNNLAVEKLETGQILIGDVGTEFILRGGSAVAYGKSLNGIPDITGGIDIKIGSKIPKNHLLLFPRDDGRGIKITSGPAYIMIIGNYQMK